MTEKEARQLMDNIAALVNKEVDKRLSNVVHTKAGIITDISLDGLKASVQLLGEDAIITDVEVYNVRDIRVGDTCHIQHWGDSGKRMNNAAIIFGGTRVQYKPVIFLTTTLPHGELFVPYSKQMEYIHPVIGGVAFTLEGGELPDGLTLTESGLITGIPLAEGEFSVRIRATNAEYSELRQFDLLIEHRQITPMAGHPLTYSGMSLHLRNIITNTNKEG